MLLKALRAEANTGYALVEPQEMDLLGGRNIHIFQAERHPEHGWRLHEEACCGETAFVRSSSAIRNILSESALRDRIAELKLLGREVCEVCAAHLHRHKSSSATK